MIIISTAIFTWILYTKCKAEWRGAGIAWVLAALLDFGLLAILIIAIFEK